jgi:hypothetical protein
MVEHLKHVKAALNFDESAAPDGGHCGAADLTPARLMTCRFLARKIIDNQNVLRNTT